MLKTTRVFFIILLSLLHCVTCNVYDDNIQIWLSYLLNKMGSCGEYFEYERIDGFVHGKLELPNIKLGDNVKMTFYKKDFSNPHNFNGIFLPDESPQEVINRLENGQVIIYRVDFPITRNVPELIKIFINGDELCTTKNSRSLEEFEILVLEHTMQIINGTLPVFSYNINIPNFVKDLTCGLVDEGIGLSPLIYGGSEIVRGEYPWLAAIYEKRRTEIKFLCGGSLLTKNIILSAAHCFQGANLNPNRITAILGRYNLSNNLEESYVRNEIEVLILHPEYKFGTRFSDADLAILKIKNLVSFSNFIKPICLWFESADESLVVNRNGVVAGWGSDENGATLSAVPKRIKMNIVSEAVCLRSSVAFNALTSARTLCAGNRDGTGPCEGDSGGGLMIKRNGRWTLRGVISAGFTDKNRCNLQDYTVYCDVAKHTKWLEMYVGEEKLLSGSNDEICGISGSKHPWLAAVYTKAPTGLSYECTGVLISSRTVLTHVAPIFRFPQYPPDFYKIYFGRNDLNNINENKVVTRDVAEIIFHPGYKKSSFLYGFQENGIALIQMKYPVGFTEYVRPICLWSESNVGQFLSQSAILSSWDFLGVLNYSLTVPSSIEVNVTSLEQCEVPVGGNSLLTLCVPRLENNSGDIMMIKRNGRWLLRGINALRHSFATHMSKEYFMYHDIAKYLPWIQENMLS